MFSFHRVDIDVVASFNSFYFSFKSTGSGWPFFFCVVHAFSALNLGVCPRHFYILEEPICLHLGFCCGFEFLLFISLFVTQI